MVKCPNCNNDSISRWGGLETCPNCGAVVRDSYLYRLACVPIPMTCAAILMNTSFPDLGAMRFMTVIIVIMLGGFALNLAFPRLKIVGFRPEHTASS